MLTKIYALPISYMILFAIIGTLIWIISGIFINKHWRTLNGVLFVLGFFIIIYITIIKRSTGYYYVSLTPFMAFINNPTNDEIYRTTILNCDMFIPFGLGLAGVIGDKMSVRKTLAIMMVAGLMLSAGIELIQYRFSIGNAEVDDIIFNMLGMAVAGAAMASLKYIKKHYRSDIYV